MDEFCHARDLVAAEEMANWLAGWGRTMKTDRLREPVSCEEQTFAPVAAAGREF